MGPDSGGRGRGRGRGRRDNGLAAAAFASVGDVDPRVGEHLLDVLLRNGIAAYLQPTVDYDSFTRAASLPRQPTDRLWVDRQRAADARDLVAAEAAAAGRGASGPGAPSAAAEAAHGADADPARKEVDEDAAWAQIVAFFDQEPAGPVAPWAVREATPAAGDGKSTDEPAGVPSAEPAAEITAEDELEDEEGYRPPPPPPLPRVSKHTAGALLAIAFGTFTLLLAPRLLDVDPDTALKVGILAIVTGVAYLIWRMQDGPPAEDRPDDGAVV